MPKNIEVPAEPIVLRFDPAVSDYPRIKEVFSNPVARTLWLMLKPGHLTDKRFEAYCLDRARAISFKEANRIDARQLYELIREKSTHKVGARFLSDSFEECEAWLARTLRAVSGVGPIRFEISIPGVPIRAFVS